MDTSSRISKIRSNERERLHGPPWLKALQRALLSCTYTMLDYAQTGLIAAVFFFKMMEWWYQSAEERMSAPTVYPPPPPPPAPKIDERVQREIMNHRSFKHPNTIRFKEMDLEGLGTSLKFEKL
ncbi:PEROXISOME ASSEMBLY PROTEIN 12 PEROXIN-12 [Salix koriyanagi]|uniref:PEROXISOME ASSEMBLY PROTEIN 12 PEROXIN-12 n=1 Tax=Salix koriyanagi TaxID=2511006 RepID=A0A9Q0PN65_9ROSI|nr:PEROXISOME ASSEMBLY PROTEIN 12 PEROXIN-12 [Salix koriyanagi]